MKALGAIAWVFGIVAGIATLSLLFTLLEACLVGFGRRSVFSQDELATIATVFLAVSGACWCIAAIAGIGATKWEEAEYEEKRAREYFDKYIYARDRASALENQIAAMKAQAAKPARRRK